MQNEKTAHYIKYYVIANILLHKPIVSLFCGKTAVS